MLNARHNTKSSPTFFFRVSENQFDFITRDIRRYFSIHQKSILGTPTSRLMKAGEYTREVIPTKILRTPARVDRNYDDSNAFIKPCIVRTCV